MYRCVKFLKKIFLKINNFYIFLKLIKKFTILPKLYIIKYIKILYFKNKKNWKNIKLKIKNYDYWF
ncbi:hypothetical protein CU086_00810 [Candidatus Nasuia deltocephalinicola]|uniref:Uncharacterized protein n=1 Tax=Candidatus Nasuia deltocephalincola TaxID=1160784 RepID=A0A975A381_9PROT|nr:hypothetical protein CU086_00810 [Candidatus Nasuia deltocephalinicola]